MRVDWLPATGATQGAPLPYGARCWSDRGPSISSWSECESFTPSHGLGVVFVPKAATQGTGVSTDFSLVAGTGPQVIACVPAAGRLCLYRPQPGMHGLCVCIHQQTLSWTSQQLGGALGLGRGLCWHSGTWCA